MRIGVDVMGGDHAPDAIVEGALGSLQHLTPDDVLVLVGDRAIVEDGCARLVVAGGHAEAVATTQVIGMEESPVEAVRTKTDSSIVVLARLASRKADRPLMRSSPPATPGQRCPRPRCSCVVSPMCTDRALR